MSQPIDANLVQARMRDLGQTIVNQTVSLFKGGTFALAAVLLLDIATQAEGRLLRLLLWGASFGLALTSYNAWLNASVVIVRESVWGVVLIVAQMMSELMLFVSLTPRFSDQAWRGWAFIYGIFALITAVRLLSNTSRNVAVDVALQPMLDVLRAQHRQAGWNLLGFATLALILAGPILFLPRTSPWPEWLSIGMAFFVAVTSLLGLANMHRERVAMERMLQDALAERSV
jgi:hypothetical protein